MRSLRLQPDRLALAALALLAVVFWGNCLWGGKVPVAAVYQKQMLPWSAVTQAGGETRQWDSLLWDSMAQFYPWRLLLHNAAKQGELPLWNPYQFCGYPFVGNGQSAMFYPPNWLYFIVHPKVGMGLSAALHFFLGSLFVFGLARKWRLSPIPATFAAVAFTYGGFMVTWIELPTLVNSLIWLPLAWWGIEVVCRSPGHVVSRRLDGPHAESYPASGPLAAPAGPDAPCDTAARHMRPLRPALRGLLMLATALGMTLLAGHFQIAAYVWIFTALYGVVRLVGLAAQRDALAMRRFVITAGVAVALGGMLALVQLLPTLELGKYSARGAGGPTASGFDFHRQRAVQPMELLTLLQADFLGTPVDGSYKGISYSEHCPYVGVTTILLGLLGLALGWRRKHLWLFFGIAAFALWGALAGPPAQLLYWFVPKLGQAGGFSRLLSVWTLAAALWGGAGLQVVLDRATASVSSVGRGLVPRRPSSATTALAAFALLLLALEMLPWAYHFNPRADAASVYPETQAIRKLREITGSNRYVAVNDRRKWGLASVPAGVVLPPNAATVYGLRCVDGYDSLFPLAYRQRAVLIDGADPSPLANGNMLLLERGTPWVGEACSCICTSDALAVRNGYLSSLWQGEGVRLIGFGPGETRPRVDLAWRHTDCPFPPPSAVSLIADDLSRVRLDLSSAWGPAAASPGYEARLTLRDALYPGWSAYVDGRNMPLTTSDTLWGGAVDRCVSVTSDTRTVDFVYYPASVACGLFVSLLALAALTALGTSGLWRRGA